MVMLALLALFLAGCKPRADVSEHVELISNFDSVGPAATFEVRFEQPIVRIDQLGVPLKNSPLIINPRVPGSFTWLSPRSGALTLTEPLAMDTRYQFTLDSGLRNAEGQPVRAQLLKTLHTPAFSITGLLPARGSTNASAEPEIKLVFNADVQAAAARKFIGFKDALGQWIAADVRQGAYDELPMRYEFANDTTSLRTWNQQFQDRNPRQEADVTNGTNAAPNFLVVTAQKPLPIGREWKLVINAGLPSSDGTLRLHNRQFAQIGDVTPFVFVGNTTHHVVNSRPTIQLNFSKRLSFSLTNQPSEWIDVTPMPTDLERLWSGTGLILRGSFRSDQNYKITLRAGVPAMEPFTLAKTQVLNVKMPPVAPRLYFPAFSNDQLAQGNRTVPLMAVNVPKVQFRAKLLDPQTAIFALRGYGSYFLPWHNRDVWNEPYRRVDYNLVPGRTVYKELIPLNAVTDESTNLLLHWDRILGGRKTGVMFLEAERVKEGSNEKERLGTQTLIQLTDLGVVWKHSTSDIQVFVFSHSTGLPVSGAKVKLLNDDNETLGQATTSKDGTTQMPSITNALWLAVQSGEDFHALEIREHKIPMYSFQLPMVNDSEADDSLRILMFTDREFYRPGETVQFKAVARDWTNQSFKIPAALAGKLTCRDERGRKFMETNIVFSAFGSYATAIPITSDSRGSYRIELRVDDREYGSSFQVQDFQPSAFEIAFRAKPEFGPDEKIEAVLSARYFFGKPLTRAQLKWSLAADDHEFKPDGFEEFAFAHSPSYSSSAHVSSTVQLTGMDKLTNATNFVIAPEMPLSAAAQRPRSAFLFAEVTDINQQTLTRQVQFIQHSSEFYLGLKQGDEIQSSNKELPLEIVAVGNDGKPWPHPVTAQVKLIKVDWESVRVQGAGRTARFRNEMVCSNISERAVEILPITAQSKDGEEVSGTLIKKLNPIQAGQYTIEVSATDSHGHKVSSALDIRVSANEPTGWDYRSDTQMKLKSDQASYSPGDTAKILVEAPFSGTALVTVEREKVLRSFTVALEGNAPLIQVPIQAGDAPNLFVSVTLVRGSDACPREVKMPEFRVGYCPLIVKDPQLQLAVNVSSPATNYLPAQPVTLTVSVKDSKGAAAVDAEVTLYAVDEGILSLSSLEMPDPYAYFFAPRRLAVESSISLPNLIEEDPQELHFGNKGYLGGGGGSEAVRKNFMACAFWNANLRTDAQGQAQATFPAPDGMTRYRVMAVVHTRESQFGSGQASFQVSKPLVVEPALPRFANVTDHLLARAVVLNQTTKSGEVEVTLQMDDRAKLTGTSPVLTRRVVVKANGSAAVEFPVEFIEAGVAKWIWKGHFVDEPQGGFTDAVQSTLNVGYPAPMLREIFLSKAENAEVNLLANANPQLVTGKGTITVELANTRLIGLSESITHLLHYPYGCVEQTSSSLLPWIVLKDQPQWRPILTEGKNDPGKAIRSGVARLFSMQTQSGGLGYWPTDREPMFWGSAYGALALALAQQHGVELPKEDFNRLLEYLSAQLRSSNVLLVQIDDLCLAAYALAIAGRAEPAYHEKLFGQREQLSSEGRALLALAVQESHGPTEMVKELLASSAARRSKDSPFGCTAREKAIGLMAVVCALPGDARIDALVTDLMNEQKEGQWTTTQGNAWALLALTEYGRRIEGNLKPSEGELRWGKETISLRLGGSNNVATHTFVYGKETNTPTLKVVSAQGTIFTSTTIAARPAVALQPRQDQGFNIQRRYQRLNDENHLEDIKNLRVADRVLVTLRLEVRQPAQYVVIDDALPSILEGINPEFKNQQTQGGTFSTAVGVRISDYSSMSATGVIVADRMRGRSVKAGGGKIHVRKEFMPASVAPEGFQAHQGFVTREGPELARSLEAALILTASGLDGS